MRTAAHPRSPPPPQPIKLTPHTQVVLEEFNPDGDAPPTGSLTAMLIPYNTSINSTNHPAISLHSPDGRLLSPKLLTPERYTWLYNQFRTHSNTPDEQFLPSLASLLHRYHPRSETLNPQGRKLNLCNHWALPTPLMTAIHDTFTSSTELYASPLNCDTANN